MDSLTAIKTAMQHWRRAQEEQLAAEKILSCGPADYFFNKVEGYVNALFTKYAPFQEKDRVVIVKAPPTKGTHWAGSAHFLVPGSKGTVVAVDYSEKTGFLADVVFDDESWIDDKGKIHPKQNSHTYHMKEDEIKKLP